MNENGQKIYGCVDGSKFSESVCDYGVEISKMLNLPFKLLNAIEHKHISSESDISGNIGLGSRENLLEKLSNEEESESKELIKYGKEILNSLKERAIKNGVLNILTAQRHGSLYENLIELESEIRVLIIGISGKDCEDRDRKVGTQVEEITRALHVPTLLVNGEFKPPKKILIAYDGSDSSKKALDMIAATPIFRNVERHIVNVCKDCSKSKTLIDDARNFLKSKNIDSIAVSLSGNAIDELINYQEKFSIDITAMGAFSHGRFRNVLLGSFTQKMLDNTKTALLLLR